MTASWTCSRRWTDLKQYTTKDRDGEDTGWESRGTRKHVLALPLFTSLLTSRSLNRTKSALRRRGGNKNVSSFARHLDTPTQHQSTRLTSRHLLGFVIVVVSVCKLRSNQSTAKSVIEKPSKGSPTLFSPTAKRVSRLRSVSVRVSVLPPALPAVL